MLSRVIRIGILLYTTVSGACRTLLSLNCVRRGKLSLSFRSSFQTKRVRVRPYGESSFEEEKEEKRTACFFFLGGSSLSTQKVHIVSFAQRTDTHEYARSYSFAPHF